MAKKSDQPKSIQILNRKARHEYFIEDIFEAGLVLSGTEVKSIREGKASITESYCKYENKEVFVIGMHISPFEQGNMFNVDPIRKRKLLLHKAEIAKIQKHLDEKGLTLVPLKIYFSRGYAKMQIGLARGKKLFDKRDTIAAKDVEREKQRAFSGRE